MSNISSSEEEDYLSMDLNELSTKPPELTYSERRKQKTAEQRQKGIIKPIRQTEQEKREEGLSTRIEPDNKGFELLKKMGYSEGMALGKSMPGRTEPIPIVIRTKHSGLGHEEELKRKRNAELEKMKIIEKKRKEEEEEDRGDFRERMMQKFAEKRAKGDAWKSRIVCEQLDRAKDIEENKFWPKRKTNEDVIEEISEEEVIPEFELLDFEEQLRQVTAYLRSVHFYCLWCGQEYQSLNEMEERCPGDTSEAH
ncbi:hypothetical protein K7432_013961 [Basidiobolus ranarum]|uniref:G-patch domain-containing protein n=1 Tax=Basidiobolus ranarum TaxID=34480 RepID=A0ABR2WIJ7_9FUNG